jgi:hypothetical protein
VNQLTYQMAITRHQELLEQAARQRLAKQAAAVTEATPMKAAGSARRRLHITTRKEFAS